MRRPLRLLAVPGLVLVAAACGGPSKGPVPLIGVQDDALLTSAEPLAWPAARDLGPDVIRYNVSWPAVAPSEPAAARDPGDPAYRWETTDALVQHAAAIGAQVLLTLVQSPSWANGGGPPEQAPDPSSYADFCAAAARRYSGSYRPPGASQALPRVRRFTVWNEPNRGQYFQPQGAGGRTAPTLYAELARACIDAIRQERPHALVAIGPLASRGAQGGLAPLSFLDAYRAAGGPKPQAMAFNAYMNGLLPQYAPDEHEPGNAVTLRNLDQLEHWLERSYGGQVPLWLTELAWRTAPTPGLGTITPERQDELTRQTIDLIREHERYVSMVVWFLLRDQSPTAYWRSGLVTFDWRRKPVFSTWSQLAAQ